MFFATLLKYIDKYKIYLLLIAIVILLFMVFNPSKRNGLTRREVKVIIKENKGLMRKYRENLDSIEFYKEMYLSEKKISDDSKIKTQILKNKLNEEVNLIRILPFDTNVALFTRDLNEYLANR